MKQVEDKTGEERRQGTNDELFEGRRSKKKIKNEHELKAEFLGVKD